MLDYEESSGSSVGWLFGGLAIGVALGMLFAPKSGEELQEDISDYWLRAREKSKDLVDRISDKIPSRVKAAGIMGGVSGAAKGAGTEAYREAKERFNG